MVNVSRLRHIIGKYVSRIKTKFRSNRGQIKCCMLAVFVWGMLAHAYAFFSGSFSHDSLAEFNAAVFGTGVKYAAGRWFVPIYRALTRSDVSLPWLIGVLSLVWIGAAVFLTTKIFDIRSKPLIWITSGIMTVNMTVSLTAASFIHDFDCDMFAMLLAVTAVFLWRRYKRGYIWGMLCIMLSLALYQSYISTAITLILMVLIFALMNGEGFDKAFRGGLRGIVMLLGGGAAYYISLKLSPLLTGITLTTNSKNSVTQVFRMSAAEIPRRIFDAYRYVASNLRYQQALKCPEWLQSGMMVVFACICAAALVFYLLKKDVRTKEKLLAVICVILLPLGMNVTYVLNNGVNNYLTIYAFWLAYLFVLLSARWLIGQNALKSDTANSFVKFGAAAMVVLILLLDVRLANAMYLKKDLEADATLSYMTRVTYAIETFDGYAPGETTVVFVGIPEQLNRRQIFEFSGYSRLTGLSSGNSIGNDSPRFYQMYYKFILGNPLIVETERWQPIRSDERVADMPCYPDEGCIQMIDDVLVVKLGELKG